MTVKVAFFTRYGRKGASSRYRFIQFFDIYRLKGLEPVHLPFYSDKYLQRRYAGKATVIYLIGAFARRFVQIVVSRKRYPLIVVEYELLPYFPRLIEKLALNWMGSPYVVEYDDAVYTRYESESMWPLKGKIPGLLQDSSLAIAGSNYLREQLISRGAKKTAVVPTSVSSQKFVDRDEQNDICTLVWIGSSTSAVYIEQISNVLKRLLKNNVRLIVIGAGDWRLDYNDNVIYKEWSEDEEAELLSQCDIGIMPMPDTDWARGKCGLKIIQYMMAGLPTVASGVGANTEIISSGVDGFLANSEEEWSQNLEVLISDAHLRHQMGKSGRAKALNKYCVEKNSEVILDLYAAAMQDDSLETTKLRERLRFEELEK